MGCSPSIFSFLRMYLIRLVRPVPSMEVNCAISYVRGTILLNAQ